MDDYRAKYEALLAACRELPGGAWEDAETTVRLAAENIRDVWAELDARGVRYLAHFGYQNWPDRVSESMDGKHPPAISEGGMTVGQVARRGAIK